LAILESLRGEANQYEIALAIQYVHLEEAISRIGSEAHRFLGREEGEGFPVILSP
jgi:hypothetical protein